MLQLLDGSMFSSPGLFYASCPLCSFPPVTPLWMQTAGQHFRMFNRALHKVRYLLNCTFLTNTNSLLNLSSCGGPVVPCAARTSPKESQPACRSMAAIATRTLDLCLGILVRLHPCHSYHSRLAKCIGECVDSSGPPGAECRTQLIFRAGDGRTCHRQSTSHRCCAPSCS